MASTADLTGLHPKMLDRGSATPLYAQLTEILREKIEAGIWGPDQKIPSENELNHLYGISRMTARQVLAQLVSEGLVFRVQGKGTFVSGPKMNTTSPAYMGIREQLEAMGYSITTTVIEAKVVPADLRVASALDIPEGRSVHLIRRVRSVDGEPISLHTSYIPEILAPQINADDLVSRQLCVILEVDHGLRMSSIAETLESTLASPRDAKDLKTGRTNPLLLLTHKISDPGGRLFEYSQILFRGDKIRLEFHYEL